MIEVLNIWPYYSFVNKHPTNVTLQVLTLNGYCSELFRTDDTIDIEFHLHSPAQQRYFCFLGLAAVSP